MHRFRFPMPDGDLSVGCFGPEAPSGARPVLHWAHANGFNGQTYAPLLAPLAERFDIYAWDARGHGHQIHRAAGRPRRDAWLAHLCR